MKLFIALATSLFLAGCAFTLSVKPGVPPVSQHGLQADKSAEKPVEKVEEKADDKSEGKAKSK